MGEYWKKGTLLSELLSWQRNSLSTRKEKGKRNGSVTGERLVDSWSETMVGTEKIKVEENGERSTTRSSWDENRRIEETAVVRVFSTCSPACSLSSRLQVQSKEENAKPKFTIHAGWLVGLVSVRNTLSTVTTSFATFPDQWLQSMRSDEVLVRHSQDLFFFFTIWTTTTATEGSGFLSKKWCHWVRSRLNEKARTSQHLFDFTTISRVENSRFLFLRFSHRAFREFTAGCYFAAFFSRWSST